MQLPIFRDGEIFLLRLFANIEKDANVYMSRNSRLCNNLYSGRSKNVFMLLEPQKEVLQEF